MLLGKRPRPPMRRTTSMTEFAPDLGIVADVETPQPSDQDKISYLNNNQSLQIPMERQRAAAADWLEPRHAAAMMAAPPRGWNRRNSGDLAVVQTAHFLKACGLCKRRLGPGRDIFMYRGEIAFCSLECRQQQMKQDERKAKCAHSSIKATPPITTGSEATSSGETVAAA